MRRGAKQVIIVVATQVAKWNKAGGKAIAGLTRRRAVDAALYAR